MVWLELKLFDEAVRKIHSHVAWAKFDRSEERRAELKIAQPLLHLRLEQFDLDNRVPINSEQFQYEVHCKL